MAVVLLPDQDKDSERARATGEPASRKKTGEPGMALCFSGKINGVNSPD